MHAVIRYRRSVALPITVASLIFLLITITAIANSNAPAQDLPDWVFLPSILFLLSAIPLGALLLTLGVRLKIAGDNATIYGMVIGTGAAMIAVWLGLWGRTIFQIMLV